MKLLRLINTSSLIVKFVVALLVFFLISCEHKHIQPLRIAENYLDHNNIDSAQYYLELVLKEDSNHVFALNQLAEIHFNKVQVGKAFEYLKKSVQIDSTDALIHLKIAEINVFLGKYQDVFSNVNKALRINERMPSAYFMKGVAYKHIGDTLKAISSLKTAIEVEHNFFPVYYELGLLLTLKGDSMGIEYYKNGVEIKPDDMDLLMSLAWSYQQFGRIRESEDCYRKLLIKSPNHELGLFNYAVLKHQLNQNDTALILVNKLLKSHPADQKSIQFKQVLQSNFLE